MKTVTGRISVKMVADAIPGYAFGDSKVPRSPVSIAEFEQLKASVGWTPEDEHFRKMAGDTLSDQVRSVVEHWRNSIIASIPHLARHSRSLDGEKLPEYLARSNLRFEQWILDTCFRPYDQAWLDYQNEVAVRHMSPRKNQTDNVVSTPYVPLRDIVAFTAVMNDTIRPYLAAKGNSPAEVQSMHATWKRSVQLQLALWTNPYMSRKTMNEW
jgi:Protoglobin